MEEYDQNMRLSDAFKRDADNFRKSHAVMLVELRDLWPKKRTTRLTAALVAMVIVLDFFEQKKEEGKDFPGPICMFQSIDLGVALSSACALDWSGRVEMVPR